MVDTLWDENKGLTWHFPHSMSLTNPNWFRDTSPPSQYVLKWVFGYFGDFRWFPLVIFHERPRLKLSGMKIETQLEVSHEEPLLKMTPQLRYCSAKSLFIAKKIVYHEIGNGFWHMLSNVDGVLAILAVKLVDAFHFHGVRMCFVFSTQNSLEFLTWAEKGVASCLVEGMLQHKQECNLPIDWNNPEDLGRFSGKDKGRLKYDLKVQESLFIKKFNCGPNCGLNEDWGSYVKTQAWTPAFNKMWFDTVRGRGGFFLSSLSSLLSFVFLLSALVLMSPIIAVLFCFFLYFSLFLSFSSFTLLL